MDFGRLSTHRQVGSFICAVLEPSWGDLGAVLNDLWVVLGRLGREDEADMRSGTKMYKNYRKTIGF